MRYDANNARGFRAWDDRRSRLVTRVVWADEDLGQYETIDEPTRVVNGAVVRRLHFAKVVGYPQFKLLILNPTTVRNAVIAADLARTLQ